MVWTIDDAAAMRRMIGYGVDGIMTNYPERLSALVG
jgi:glycerophosphoryl diester phosphodiesterase